MNRTLIGTAKMSLISMLKFIHFDAWIPKK